MRALKLVCLLLSLMASSVSAQTIQSCEIKGGVTFESNKPTVYISFENVNDSTRAATRLASVDKPSERSNKEQKKFPDSAGEVIWLRLHNNMRWAISVPTDSLYLGPAISPIRLCNGRSALGIRDGMKINVRYEVELLTRSDRELPLLSRSDVFSASWLPAGGSVLFGVAREHLIENSIIYVPYNYEWEYGERTFTTNEPQHRVLFRGSDLPKNLRVKSSK